MNLQEYAYYQAQSFSDQLQGNEKQVWMKLVVPKVGKEEVNSLDAVRRAIANAPDQPAVRSFLSSAFNKFKQFVMRARQQHAASQEAPTSYSVESTPISVSRGSSRWSPRDVEREAEEFLNDPEFDTETISSGVCPECGEELIRVQDQDTGKTLTYCVGRDCGFGVEESKVEEALRPVRITWNDGDTTETEINGSTQEIWDYYVGKEFNLGDGAGGDLMKRAVNVEFLDGDDRMTCKCGNQFTPSYGEYARCPDCTGSELTAAERATGVQ